MELAGRISYRYRKKSRPSDMLTSTTGCTKSTTVTHDTTEILTQSEQYKLEKNTFLQKL